MSKFKLIIRFSTMEWLFGCSLALFFLIYIVLWPFVGRFPAESMNVIEAGGAASRLLCYSPQDTYRNIVLSPFRAATNNRVLSLSVNGILTAEESNDITASRDLFFARQVNKLFAINFLTPADVSLISALESQGHVNSQDALRFKTAALSFGPPCVIPLADPGVTEAYWATKGTAVLHHWAFLYDSSVHDGRPAHAQYGYLVSNLASIVARIVPIFSPATVFGPTLFVRVAWMLFALVGFTYIICMFRFFSRDPLLVFLAITFQIYLFVSLFPFSILLAPGYQWTRELVLLWPTIWLIIKGRTTNVRSVSVISFFVLIAVGAFLLDPTFFLLSVIALSISAVLYFRSRLLKGALEHASLNGFLTLGAAATIAFLFTTDHSNISYAIQHVIMMGNITAIGEHKLLIIALNWFTAMALIWLSLRRSVSFISLYFAIVSFGALAYYFTMPDEFHFAKYIAYLVPMYLCFAEWLLDRAGGLRSSISNLLSTENATSQIIQLCTVVAAAGALILALALPDLKTFFSFIASGNSAVQFGFLCLFFALWILERAHYYRFPFRKLRGVALKSVFAFGALSFITASVYTLYTPPWAWQLRIIDSLGQPYFRSSPHLIDGRLIDANLNSRTTSELGAFPGTAKFDYIVSPLDKYILFLYDAHNGFNSPDFVSSLDSAAKLSIIENMLLSSHATIEVSYRSLSVNPLAGILSNNPIIGTIDDQSALDIKARIRMAELSSFLLSHCPSNKQNEYWISVHC